MKERRVSKGGSSWMWAALVMLIVVLMWPALAEWIDSLVDGLVSLIPRSK